MLQSWTDGKNKTLLGQVKDLCLMFWHRFWEKRVSLGKPISTGLDSKVKQSLRWHK
jgi:hypothetical protein